ncbi:coat protein [Sulfolobales Mexican rudivirus 1]|uniref:Coat protein n=1 Tax=Sulfolobales Mexican rod-shaped virus 1 TaxID=2848122 RepID=K4PAJ9_9VIRU|nr:coat protein [Sulfolobales Mexican rudivirus 1]AFV51252.1 coat protein [Sulfolobales Mexican rod-shaped virus 1]
MAKGHTPRSFAQRYGKWQAKFTAFSNPTVANTILTAVTPVAQGNFEQNSSLMASMNQQVAGLLTELGITGPNRVIYQGFALKLYRAKNRIGNGPALGTMAQGLKQYYVSAYNANPSVLDQIIAIVTGSSTGYVS